MYYSRYLNSKLRIDIRNRVNCVKYYETDGVYDNILLSKSGTKGTLNKW